MARGAAAPAAALTPEAERALARRQAEAAKEAEERIAAAKQRIREQVKHYPKAVVEHPVYGVAVVRGMGKLLWLDEAADLWGVDRAQMRGADVWQKEGYILRQQKEGVAVSEPVLVGDKDALYALVRETVPQDVRGELPPMETIRWTRNDNHGSVTAMWPKTIGTMTMVCRARLHVPLGQGQLIFQVLGQNWKSEPYLYPVELDALRERGLIEEEGA